MDVLVLLNRVPKVLVVLVVMFLPIGVGVLLMTVPVLPKLRLAVL